MVAKVEGSQSVKGLKTDQMDSTECAICILGEFLFTFNCLSDCHIQLLDH